MVYLLTFQEPYESTLIFGLFETKDGAQKERDLQIDLGLYQFDDGACLRYPPEHWFIEEMEIRT